MKSRPAKSWTEEQLIEAVKISKSYSEVARRIGLSTYGANSRTIKKYIKLLKLDTSHFLSTQELAAAGCLFNARLTNNEIFIENSFTDRKFVKKIIMRENLILYKCALCQITEWQGQSLSLHLDHINGVSSDNRLENLRFLCPNCHSLTDTYCGRQLRGATYGQPNYCKDCNTEIFRYSIRCQSCSTFKYAKPKIKWPSTKKISRMVEKEGYSATGRKLGVSGNAVKKRIKNHPTK